MPLSHLIIAAGWILYCALHSVLAAPGVKHWFGRFMGASFHYYRLIYTCFALAGLAVMILLLLTTPSHALLRVTRPVRVSGIVIALLGLMIMTACIVKYFLQTSGLRALIQSGEKNELMITGMHRFVRHPLYGGTFVFIWGAWLAWPTESFLITNLIITIYTLIGLRFEEGKLTREFGSAYAHYKKNVPMIIPRLGRSRQSNPF